MNSIYDRFNCLICNVQLPKITPEEFKTFVCVCQRNQTNPHAYARDLIEAGAVFCCLTGKRKN